MSAVSVAEIATFHSPATKPVIRLPSVQHHRLWLDWENRVSESELSKEDYDSLSSDSLHRYIRSCLLDDSVRMRTGVTRAFIAGALLGSGAIDLPALARESTESQSLTFEGIEIDKAYVDELKIYTRIKMLGFAGFFEIADRLDELWAEADLDPEYSSINCSSLEVAIKVLTFRRWIQRPAIAVERDGTVTAKWGDPGKGLSILMAFLPDDTIWYKIKRGQERHIEVLPTDDALHFVESFLVEF